MYLDVYEGWCVVMVCVCLVFEIGDLWLGDRDEDDCCVLDSVINFDCGGVCLGNMYVLWEGRG